MSNSIAWNEVVAQGTVTGARREIRLGLPAEFTSPLFGKDRVHHIAPMSRIKASGGSTMPVTLLRSR
jgi:hypothetical protein